MILNIQSWPLELQSKTLQINDTPYMSFGYHYLLQQFYDFAIRNTVVLNVLNFYVSLLIMISTPRFSINLWGINARSHPSRLVLIIDWFLLKDRDSIITS